MKNHLIHGAIVGVLLLLAAVFSVKTTFILAEEKRLKAAHAADVADRQKRMADLRSEANDVLKRSRVLFDKIHGPIDHAAADRGRELLRLKPR